MIISDPCAKANATRNTSCDASVESIDLVATFVEMAGGKIPDHIIEGRSLLPLLHGEAVDWRDYVISEYDYSVTPQALRLELETRDCRLFVVFDGRFKSMHAEGGFQPSAL